MIGRVGDVAERDPVLIFDEYLKILPRLQMELIPDGPRQDDLAFSRGDGV